MSDARSPDLPSLRVIRPGMSVGPKPHVDGPKIPREACSSLGAFAICPQYHAFAYEKGLQPTERREPLILGTLIHAGLAYRYGMRMNPRPAWMVYPTAEAPSGRDAIWTIGQTDLDLAERALKIFDAYEAYYTQPTLQPVLIEHQLEALLDLDGQPMRYTLRIDLLAYDWGAEGGGALTLLDHKSAYKLTKWIGHDYRADREMLTALALCRAAGYDVQRVVINAIQKGTKEKPEPQFQRYGVPISETAYARLGADTAFWLRRIRDIRITHPNPEDRPRTLESCVRKYGRCLVAGTHVRTDRGWLPIEGVREGDSVVGADGQYHHVGGVTSRPYEGEIVHVQTRRNGLGVRTTPEHQILLRHDKWSDATSVRPGDETTMVVPPSDYRAELDLLPEVDDIVCPRRPYPERQDPRVVAAIIAARGTASHRKVARCFDVDPGVVRRIWRNVDKSDEVRPVADDKQITLYGEQFRPLPRRILVDEKFAELAGLYAAEGAASSKLVFSFGAHEGPLIQRCRQLVHDVLGEPSTVGPRGSVTEVRVSHHLWAQVFRRWFGTSSETKRIPTWLETAPFNVFRGVLRGWLEGDGGDMAARAYGVTTSPGLALQMISGLARERLFVSLNRMSDRCGGFIGERQIVQRNTSYVVQIGGEALEALASYLGVACPNGTSTRRLPDFDETRIYPVVRKTSRMFYKGNVYDLNVPEGSAFLANGIVVHNCDFYPVCADGPQNLAQYTRKW